MTPPRIRPIAIALLRRGEHILVGECYDRVKKQTFHRPLGGGIEFGESGAAAVAREIREEIGAEITDVRFAHVFENIFTCEGAPGHEIVLIYEARFVDASCYERELFEAVEDHGAPFRAVWRDPRSSTTECPLYPDGLPEFLNRQIITANRK